MYGIKVWLSEDTKDWYLLRDMDDGVVHVWDNKEDGIESAWLGWFEKGW